MIGTDTRLIFNEKHDLSVKRQLSKRVLRVAELMILLGGGPASYLECGGNALPPEAVTRYFPPGFLPEEAVSSYLALCSLLDSDEIFFPDRIQTHVLRGVLSEYVAGMDRGGIGTLTRFDNHKEVYAAVRAGLKSLASGRWDPPFIYLFAYDYAGAPTTCSSAGRCPTSSSRSYPPWPVTHEQRLLHAALSAICAEGAFFMRL